MIKAISLPIAALSVLALAPARPAHASCPNGTTTSSTWTGSRPFWPRVDVAGGRPLATYWDNLEMRTAAIAPDGSIVHRASVDTGYSYVQTMASGPDSHLHITVDPSYRLQAQRIAADGEAIGGLAGLDTVDDWETYPAAIFDGAQYVVAWARPAGWERWQIAFSTLGEGAGEAAPLQVVGSSSWYSAPQVALVRTGDVTWILWFSNETGESAVESPLFGVRLGSDGTVLDATPIPLGRFGVIEATASLDGHGLLITGGTIGLHQIDRLGPDGLLPPQAELDAPSYLSLGLFPVPALDGYAMWMIDDSTWAPPDDFPNSSATIVGYLLNRDGTPRSLEPFATIPGRSSGMGFDGQRFYYTDVQEVTDGDAGTSTLLVGTIDLDGAVGALAPAAVNELTLEHETVCIYDEPQDCNAGGGASGGLLLLGAISLATLPRRRRTAAQSA